jgi:redox-sensitive bicupin YhaK (pirin superfamily)
MITLRPSSERGHFNHGWLDTRHSFSFADYYDPHFMGFGVLRVINEDYVQPGKGFGTHPHNNMEIITYIISGALEHRDSMGNGSVIRPGEVQRMSAGSGITHSEFNPSSTESVHLLQIWILPNKRNIEPSYEQKNFQSERKAGEMCLVASPDGRNGSVTINQFADVHSVLMESGQSLEHSTKTEHNLYLQVIKGEISINKTKLADGDGAAIKGESSLQIECVKAAEFLLFDME